MEYIARRCVGDNVEECGMDVITTDSENDTLALLRLDVEEVVVEEECVEVPSD